MKPGFRGQPNPKLRQASKNPSVTAIQMGVPIKTRVKNPSQNPGQRCTNCEPTAPKSHIKEEFIILFKALRAIANVVPPIVIVLGQNSY